MFGLSITTGKKKKEQIKFLEQQLHQRGKDNAVIAERLREVEARNKEVEISYNKISDDRTSLSRRLGEIEKELSTAKEKIEQFKSVMVQYEQATFKFAEAASEFESEIDKIDVSFIREEEKGTEEDYKDDPVAFRNREMHERLSGGVKPSHFDATEDSYGDD